MSEGLNESKTNSKRIELVEQCFGFSNTIPLSMPGRVLVGEGALDKMCRKGLQKRQFFLFNDILVYGKIVMKNKKYCKQKVINLENVTLQTVTDDEELRFGWQIKSPRLSFTVYANKLEEKSLWMTHINNCIHKLNAKNGRTSDEFDSAPVWTPDKDAKVCMVCKKSEFTMINRRHHCRKCGRIVCDLCSSQKWLLPRSTKPERICSTCYMELSSVENKAIEHGATRYDDDSSSNDEEYENYVAGERSSFYKNCNRDLTL